MENEHKDGSGETFLNIFFGSEKFESHLTPASLFHYTKNEAINKIVKDDCVDFRFSRAEDFLDKNEGLAILEPYYHACGFLFDKGIIDEGFYRITKEISAKNMPESQKRPWILCMSANGSSDFMKERYAPHNGWIISINPKAVVDVQKKINTYLIDFRVIQASYSFSSMKECLEDDIIKIFDFYNRNKDENVTEKIRNLIMQELLYYNFCYKSSSFSREEEIRIICTMNDGFSSWSSEDGTHKFIFVSEKGEVYLHWIMDRRYCIGASQSMFKETKS